MKNLIEIRFLIFKKYIWKISSIQGIKKLQEKIEELQFCLFTAQKCSLLVVFQAPDIGGMDYLKSLNQLMNSVD